MPEGAGHYTVEADDKHQARRAAFSSLGCEWGYIFDAISDVHPKLRKCHGHINDLPADFINQRK